MYPYYAIFGDTRNQWCGEGEDADGAGEVMIEDVIIYIKAFFDCSTYDNKEYLQVTVQNALSRVLDGVGQQQLGQTSSVWSRDCSSFTASVLWQLCVSCGA